MKTTFCLIALIALYLVVGTMDFNDQMNIENERVATALTRSK